MVGHVLVAGLAVWLTWNDLAVIAAVVVCVYGFAVVAERSGMKSLQGIWIGVLVCGLLMALASGRPHGIALCLVGLVRAVQKLVRSKEHEHTAAPGW